MGCVRATHIPAYSCSTPVKNQDNQNMAPGPVDRLKSVASQLGGSNTVKLPTFDELPNFKNFAGCAWGVWGPDDQLGTVNLLTDEVVQRTAAEEIRYALILELLLGVLI